MFYNIINLPLSGLSLQEKLNWGGNGLVIGLGSVFTILVILIGVINILKLTNKQKKNTC